MPHTYSLFPNGTAFECWIGRNCDSCRKGFPSDKDGPENDLCDIEENIALASATDGTLLHGGHTPLKEAESIAKRLKWSGSGYLERDCPEFEPFDNMP